MQAQTVWKNIYAHQMLKHTTGAATADARPAARVPPPACRCRRLTASAPHLCPVLTLGVQGNGLAAQLVELLGSHGVADHHHQRRKGAALPLVASHHRQAAAACALIGESMRTDGGSVRGAWRAQGGRGLEAGDCVTHSHHRPLSRLLQRQCRQTRASIGLPCSPAAGCEVLLAASG